MPPGGCAWRSPLGGARAVTRAAARALVARELLERGVGDSLLGRPRGREVGIEHDQRRVVGALIADAAGLADQRRGALDGRLDVGRGHVLAARADDQLLLAVDDPQ